MTWTDIERILYDGNKEDIKNVRCPDCNGVIEYCYWPHTNTFRTMCGKCGVLNIYHT